RYLSKTNNKLSSCQIPTLKKDMVSMDFVGMTLNLQFCCKIKINIQRGKNNNKKKHTKKL
ncbi:MAG: hypothetical protein ACRC29_11975, partial [Enterobacterales bacterium]